MVAKHEHVNDKSSCLRTLAERIVEERKRIRLSQADFAVQAGVGRTTQLKYESGDGEPGAYYLYRLDVMDVDVRYIVTGYRQADSLDTELQNLVEAYVDAPDAVRRAAFGVLLSPYARDVERARVEPGWFRHEVKGEGDVRFVQYQQGQLRPQIIHDGGEPPRVPGQVLPPKRLEEPGPQAAVGDED